MAKNAKIMILKYFANFFPNLAKILRKFLLKYVIIFVSFFRTKTDKNLIEILSMIKCLIYKVYKDTKLENNHYFLNGYKYLIF